MFDNYKIRAALGAHKASDQNLLRKIFQNFCQYLISILIIDCRHLSSYKIFTFQLENDRRPIETSLCFHVMIMKSVPPKKLYWYRC